MVRLDTYKASAFLVWQLKHAGAVILEDGGDIIHVRVQSGEVIGIHLIESSIPAYEIKNTLVYNDANGVHTLFLLWCDMLLPPEGDVVQVQEWEWPLLSLYRDSIYAYDILGGEIFIFPVHYDAYGPFREIRYGKTVSMRQLTGGMVEIFGDLLRGSWRVADFNENVGTSHHHWQDPFSGGSRDGAATDKAEEMLAACFMMLGLARDADEVDVKTAYRRLARRVHPDVNRSPDATARMQALNEAYQKLMKLFEEETDATA